MSLPLLQWFTMGTGAVLALATLHAKNVRSQLGPGECLGHRKHEIVDAGQEHYKHPFIVPQGRVIAAIQ